VRPARDNVVLIIGIRASLFFREIQETGEIRRERQGSSPAMNAAVRPPSSSVTRASTRDRALRRVRSLAPLQAGQSYAAIARQGQDDDAAADENSPNGDAALDIS
jgi:hypothetical protein